MTKPLDLTDELAGLAKAIWRADHDGADLPDDQVPSFEALARALDEPYMEDARAEDVARLDRLYRERTGRERTGRERTGVADDPEWGAAYRASIDAVYHDGCGREPPDDPDEGRRVMSPLPASLMEPPPRSAWDVLASSAARG